MARKYIGTDMNNESLSIHKSWQTAQQVAELAYIHQRQLSDSTFGAEPDIVKTLNEVSTLLLENQEKWKKSVSPIFETAAVNTLAEIFTYMMNGELSDEQSDSPLWKFLTGSSDPQNNPLNQEGLKLAIWRTLTSPGSPEYDDLDLAMDYRLPTKEEIKEKGGPQDFARWYWHDQGGKSETTIRNYRDKIKKKKIVFSPSRYFLPFTERYEFIGAVCGGLLELSKDEMLIISEELKQIAMKMP